MPQPLQAGPGTWRTADGSPVAFQTAIQAWAEAAREILIESAGTYHAYVTYAELAEGVQARSGIRTRSQMRNWIGKVLGAVVEESARRSEPPLTALCVHQDETVGLGYEYVLQVAGESRPDDLDAHAAEARLACYRHFGAELPTGGGVAVLPPKVAAARRRAEETRPLPPPACPSCHVQLPRSGACDHCA